jgi:MFS family permease
MFDGRRILYATAFLRAVSTGLVGVLLGVYLAKVGLSCASVGVVIAAGLVGATLSAVLATFWGDRIGRRRMLFGLSAFAVAGTVGVANVSGPLALAIFALMGKDRGAALILERPGSPPLSAALRASRSSSRVTSCSEHHRAPSTRRSPSSRKTPWKHGKKKRASPVIRKRPCVCLGQK